MRRRLMYENIGKFIKQKRMESGLSQQAIADELGFATAQYLSNIERGIAPPSVDILRVIKKKCKVKADLIADVMATETRKFYLKELK